MNKSAPLLDIKNLSVSFRSVTPEGKEQIIKAVRGVSFYLERGKILGIVGESGSGKSVTALSILKLLPYPTAFHPTGKILFAGEDNLTLGDTVLNTIRGKRIGMIFQEPMTSLNPLHTIEKQLKEVLHLHQNLTPTKTKARIAELLEMVGLEELLTRLHAYPHQLSGGQRQRVMIAMALANNPDILIADEPTTALDVTIQAQILELLLELKEKLNMAILLITHDLTIVKNMADNVGVMHEGKLVEMGAVKQIFGRPKHRYTKHLLGAAPTGNPVKASAKASALLKSQKLCVHFPIKRGIFGRTKGYIKAADNINLTIKKGHTLGVVGESGSGKSTLALALLRLISSKGTITFGNQQIEIFQHKDIRQLRQRMQIVFQDPFSSLNPRMTIGDAIAEGLKAHNIEDQAKRINSALKEVGLDPAMKHRYPHEFSGGQRQRICIARALALEPEFIVLDEPTSALDLCTQSEILELLKELQKKHKLTYMFISHDLRVIKAISHDIIVMKAGKIIEKGTRSQVFTKPKTAYTKTLIKAALGNK